MNSSGFHLAIISLAHKNINTVMAIKASKSKILSLANQNIEVKASLSFFYIYYSFTVGSISFLFTLSAATHIVYYS